MLDCSESFEGSVVKAMALGNVIANVVCGKGGGGGGGGGGGLLADDEVVAKMRPFGRVWPGVVGVAGSCAADGGSSPFLMRISRTSSTIWLLTFF